MAGVMVASRGILARLSPPDEREGNGRAQVAQSRLPVSLVALSAAAGVLVAAAAYTAGRLGYSGSPWADRAYWLGQALILVPSAVRLLSRRAVTAAETATVIVVMTVAEYLVKVCYSPAAFAFPDELEHWRGTTNILQTGALFTPNNLLPVSSLYPGLEELTSALSAITGLPVFISGLIVAGAAHLLFVCLIYLLFRHISGSARLAGIAVLLYVGNSHFQYFDSMFAYQTLAVAFLGLTLLAAWRLTASPPSRERAGWSHDRRRGHLRHCGDSPRHQLRAGGSAGPDNWCEQARGSPSISGVAGCPGVAGGGVCGRLAGVHRAGDRDLSLAGGRRHAAGTGFSVLQCAGQCDPPVRRPAR